MSPAPRKPTGRVTLAGGARPLLCPGKVMTKRLSSILLGLMLLTLFSPHHGSAQPSEELKVLQKEIEALKEGQIAIQQELQEIKSLLRARQAPQLAETQEVVFSIDDDPFRGDRSAKLTLIEFSDYQCPFCARHFREILPQIEREYIKSGKVKYVFRHFPIESIHKEAFKAAEAANCAGEQGKYWEMHAQRFAQRIGIPKHFLRPRERTPWSPPAPSSPATPPERPGARRCTALRGLGWCWTDAAGWGRVVPRGCPGATASGRATGKAWGGGRFQTGFQRLKGSSGMRHTSTAHTSPPRPRVTSWA
jgi:hypothetical protein